MELKKSFSILVSNVGYGFKIFLWVVISLVITGAIGTAILAPQYRALTAATDIAACVGELKATLTTVWNGTVNMRVVVGDVFNEVMAVLKELFSVPSLAVGVVFSVIFLYAIYSFLSGLQQYTVADIINNLMASNLRFGFASGMVKNLKKSALYSASKLLMTLPIDICCFLIVGGGFYGLFKSIGLFAMPIMLVVGLLVLTCRSILFSGWLPRMMFHPDERVYTNFTRAFTFIKWNFASLFKSFLVVYIIAYVVAAVCTTATYGLILVIVPSVYQFLFRAIELIGYYKTQGMSFYVDGATVINTLDYGYKNTLMSKND